MINSTVFIFANICLLDSLKPGYCQDRRLYGSDKPGNHANDSSLIFENAACENCSHFDWTRKSQNATWVSCPWYNNNNNIYLLASSWVDGTADYNIDYVKVKGKKGNNIIVHNKNNNGYNYKENSNYIVATFNVLLSRFSKARKIKWPSFLPTKGLTLLKRKSIISFELNEWKLGYLWLIESRRYRLSLR